ncbi:helix-turn-helix transcriptional regulator, partial [Dysosmobacter sp.]|uniref:helix-turn-helix transcriptional regulator n=1 Tax=Dysosmobacter sp. TaxID=2591382 RepID=UPI003AB76DAC
MASVGSMPASHSVWERALASPAVKFKMVSSRSRKIFFSMAVSSQTDEFLRPVYRISTNFARFFSNVAFGCGPETLPWWTCPALFGKIGAEAREELPMNFSKKLIRLRKREGISQEELASYLEVSRQAVSRWEQGTALPDAGNLLKLRQRFGV